jgi:sigma54-dependent transcription regulator
VSDLVLIDESRAAAAVIEAGRILRAAARVSAAAVRPVFRPTPSRRRHDADPAVLDAIVDGGVIVGAGEAAAAGLSTAWRHSTVRALARSIAADAAALDLATRLQLTGVVLGSALLTSAALSLPFDRPGISVRSLVWMAGAITALVLFAKPSAVAAAWTDRRR